MTTNGVVTLFRPNGGSLGILCLGTVPAWVHREKLIKNDGAGVYKDNHFDVRIEKGYIDDVREGDLIFFGRAESGSVSLVECERIASAILNDFGRVPHWHLRSGYRYR